MADPSHGRGPASAAPKRISPGRVHFAWAKVNLYLHITGRRPDGYHEIDSLIVFAGVGDRLTLAPAPELSLSLEGPFAAAVPAGEDNLVLRAARALAAACGITAGARIGLHKTLPVAAGLGGGSADAAAALDGLAALWGLARKRTADAQIALALGADVPVCRFGRPAFVDGIGARIVRAPPLPAAWLVLVNCGVPLSTADVFAARGGAFSAPGGWSASLADPGPLADAEALADVLHGLENDLEAPARRLAPEIDEVLVRLADTSGSLLTRLSGSGATCFGLFPSLAEAEAAAAAIAADRPDWWVAAAPLLHGPMTRPWNA